jgi:hypothetical protein
MADCAQCSGLIGGRRSQATNFEKNPDLRVVPACAGLHHVCLAPGSMQILLDELAPAQQELCG